MTAQTVCERVLAAPIQRDWDAWTDPALLAQWYCPNPAMALTVEADARPGSHYRVDMGGSYIATGEYTRVEAPTTLAFTWHWEHEDVTSAVLVELTEVDGGTHLRLTHHDLPTQEDADGHGEGWNLSLDRLEGLLAAG